MIDIKRKEDCVGCGACHDACPKNAIFWEIDIEGFWYPEINLDKCVGCDLCEKVCPVINSDKLNLVNIATPSPKVLASYNADSDIRIQSTSGGVFSALAERMLSYGGYICGAVWTEDFGARHILSNKSEDLLRIRGSKYIQSDMTMVFKEIRTVLNRGEKVLVCGCPCQMAGLRAFLRKDYDHLVIVDFICCSINSPKLFKEYIKDLEQQYGSEMEEYHPKNKEYGGWHKFAFKATFKNGLVYAKNRTDDEFTKCFIGTHIAGRPSCFDCRYKRLPRVADITIADFWGIENVDPDFDSPDGVSLVLLNNDKGQRFYTSLEDTVISKEETLKNAIRGNGNLVRSPCPSIIDRRTFYEALDQYGFRYAMDTYGHPKISFKQRVRYFIKRRFLRE